jgi:hypothetical protein
MMSTGWRDFPPLGRPMLAGLALWVILDPRAVVQAFGSVRAG